MLTYTTLAFGLSARVLLTPFRTCFAFFLSWPGLMYNQPLNNVSGDQLLLSFITIAKPEYISFQAVEASNCFFVIIHADFDRSYVNNISWTRINTDQTFRYGHCVFGLAKYSLFCSKHLLQNRYGQQTFRSSHADH